MPKSSTYQRRKDAGICVTCGKRPAKATSVLCPSCTHAANVNGALMRYRRQSAGLCIRCNRPAVTAQHCQHHRQEANAYNLIRYHERKRTA